MSSYSLSGYTSAEAFPVGWGDVRLGHSGSNTQWYSQSSVFLHGERPFAVLAAFNAAPANSSLAMRDLFCAVTARWTRWLEAERIAAVAPYVNPQRCKALTPDFSVINGPLSGPSVASWALGAVTFTAVALNTTAVIHSMSLYPYVGNVGLFNVTVALYSKYGVLIGQSAPTMLNGSQYTSKDTLTPFNVSLTHAVWLMNDTYYAALYFASDAAVPLLMFAYPASAWQVTVPVDVTYAGTGGDLMKVAAERWLAGASRFLWSALVKLSGHQLSCTPPASAAPTSPTVTSAAVQISDQ